MDILETLKKFVRSHHAMEKVALELYERLPLYFRNKISISPVVFHWIAFLRESEKWPDSKVKTYQFEQLKKLLVYSKKNIPYYKKLFADHQFQPEKMQCPEDISVLPYLDRETVRDRPNEFLDCSASKRNLIKECTSGSTGIPLTVYKTKEAKEIFLAFWLDLLGRVGYTLKSREVKISNMIESGGNGSVPFSRYGNKLILSNRHLTDEWLLKYAEMIKTCDPEFILGFPTTLTILAGFFRKNDLLPCKNVKAVIVYAETLYDWQRSIIETGFNARVFSVYGMAESAVLGGGCEYSSVLHLYPQRGYNEFIGIENGHEEIVSTGLNNYAMPFIRYRTGDVVTGTKRHSCKCGRHYQFIDRVEGRISDFLINKGGGIIPRLMPWIKVFPNTKQCQFFQEEPGKAYLKIIPKENYLSSDTSYIRSKVKEMLGPLEDSIDIEIVLVDDIVRSSSGKTKLVDQQLDIRKYLAT
jgi:phenylacetate-CoA ligase